MGDLLLSDAEATGAWPDFALLAEAERARLLRLATRSCEAYVGRALGRGEVAEVHRPGPSRVIYLRVTPIESIASVALGRAGSQTTLAEGDDYAILDAADGTVELYRDFAPGYRWPDRTYGGDPRTGSLAVAYVGGWATADVPDDIKQAAILIVRDASARATVRNGGIFASEQIGPYSYKTSSTFTETQTQVAVSLNAIGYLKHYRRVRLA